MAVETVFPRAAVALSRLPRRAEPVQAPAQDGEVEDRGAGGGRGRGYFPHETTQRSFWKGEEFFSFSDTKNSDMDQWVI